MLTKALALGPDGDDFGRAIAEGSESSLYIAGSFENNFTISGTTLAARGDNDGFVIKLDADGALLWARSFGGAGQEDAHTIVASGDDLVVAVSFNTTIDLDGAVLVATGESDTALFRLSGEDGSLLWYHQLGGSHRVDVRAMAATPGLLGVGGGYSGLADFGGRTSRSQDSEEDGFVIFLKAIDGEISWLKILGKTGIDSVLDMAIDANNNLLIGGYFTSQIPDGDSTLDSMGGTDGFYSRMDSTNGYILWSGRVGSTGNDKISQVLITDDSTWVAGSYEIELPFGSGTLTTEGGSDLFAGEVNSSGGAKWAFSLGSTEAETDITLSYLAERNEIIIAAPLGPHAQLGPDAKATTTQRSMIIAGFMADALLKTWYLGGDECPSALPAQLITYGDGLALVGSFTDTIALEGIPLTSDGGSDIFYGLLGP